MSRDSLSISFPSLCSFFLLSYKCTFANKIRLRLHTNVNAKFDKFDRSRQSIQRPIRWEPLNMNLAPARNLVSCPPQPSTTDDVFIFGCLVYHPGLYGKCQNSGRRREWGVYPLPSDFSPMERRDWGRGASPPSLGKVPVYPYPPLPRSPSHTALLPPRNRKKPVRDPWYRLVWT